MQVNGFPTVTPEVGQVRLLTSGVPETLTGVEAVAGVLPVLESRAVLLIVYGPFGEQVTDIVLVVDVPVHPAGRVQVNV